MVGFLFVGKWSRVEISWVGSARRVVPEVEEAIEREWAAALTRPGIQLFDGPMCRVESILASGPGLKIALSHTSYKPFFGTNMTHPEFAERFGPEVMANPLGVSPALLTADGYLLLGRRNASVAYYPNRIHPFAGSMEPADADVFATVYRELLEEVLIAPQDICDIRCIGAVRDCKLLQPEAVFAVTTTRSKAEVELGLDGAEHRGMWSIPADAKAIEAAIKKRDQLTPVAIGTLLLWGRLRFGDDWFDKNKST